MFANRRAIEGPQPAKIAGFLRSGKLSRPGRAVINAGYMAFCLALALFFRIRGDLAVRARAYCGRMRQTTGKTGKLFKIGNAGALPKPQIIR